MTHAHDHPLVLTIFSLFGRYPDEILDDPSVLTNRNLLEYSV